MFGPVFDPLVFAPVVLQAGSDCAFDASFDESFDVCTDAPVSDGGRHAVKRMVRRLPSPIPFREDPDELLALI